MKKVALVTGGSRGIGKAIALKLGKMGYDVAINYNSDAISAEGVATEIRQYGQKAIIIQADVSQESALVALVETVVSELGSIDVLVNNAGITRDNLLILMKESQWQEVIDTDLLSVVRLIDLVLPHMTRGKIVNIGSIVGVHGNAGQANYSTAKAALIGLTRIKARELMPLIQVNCIAPGLVATDMTKDFDISRITETPLGRAATPDDIAECVGWLVAGGDYVTGQVIEIDGGLSLQRGLGL